MHSTMQSVTGSSGPSRGKTCGSWLRFAAASMSIVQMGVSATCPV